MVVHTGGAHAAAAAVVAAIRASGVVVRLDPEAFQAILRRAVDPLVVTAPGGLFGGKHSYLMSYKGLAFHTTSAEPIPLPAGTEIVTATKLWVP